MANPPFDASKAVTFDLSRGQIHKDGGGSRLLVSPRALLAFCHGQGGVDSFGRAMGADLGAAVAARFAVASLELGQASIDAITEHLGAELALIGFGKLTIERWGHALVLVVDHAPLAGDADPLLSAILAGALSQATSAQVCATRLTRDGERVRFLVTGQAGADKVRGWLEAGVSWGEALVRLHPQPGRGAA